MQMDSIIRSQHPELGTLQQFEEWLQEKISEKKYQKTDQNFNYIIPIIVHVINNGEAIGSISNISNAQIQSQLDVLNEDYRRLNPNFSDLTAPPYNATNWASIAADCQITFCWAVKDPQGNLLAVPGVDRINRKTLGFNDPPYAPSYINDTIKPQTIWDPYRYLNIWVLSLTYPINGYATFPIKSTLNGLSNGLTGTAKIDGVVINFHEFGKTGNLQATYNLGKTTTHEIGHWLGLRHVWGEDAGPCSTDYCDDTPNQEAYTAGCPAFPHISCDNGPDGDMFVNYMDYTNDGCSYMFTNDQKMRMQVVMENSPFRINVVKTPSTCDSGSVTPKPTVNIYPNPSFDGKFKILTNDTINSVIIYNMLAQPVEKILTASYGNIDIDFSHEASGMYFVVVTTTTGTTNKKVVIR